MAAKVHLSPNYLATLFKKEAGTTLNDYVTRTRIYHAKRLLSESNLLIQEIAEKVGYKDVKYFTKLFKKEVGDSPRAYRDQ
ncbi:helix-turn-helix transcriptional regulator [Paenibacillus sp. S3N08]|uniref:Helix-turn-helix transcriptional regulator n=1 Tax=Paenibacillus agricola TaxID=2716264 RepID=A0ABX0J6Z3_9BACL|nr:helix-turn-helix transcriptional regulator [Paenibacillus agricola]